ncbi:MAG: 16S rRNA (cytidine(1402)-2'-O)-methyltransferase [Alphaproteobacteria bacterium]|nr:16S rRNA (cytidine(1402)-2'-O)-methyltransferase [Alphaproteobacteria bacterium]
MLTLVSTPIGNLGDMPPRGVTALQDADLVLCEDTRVTRKLTTRLGIETRLMALHDHNEQQMVEGVLKRLLDGQKIALVSDAGMPLISDPGYRLVRAVIEAGLPLTGVPGANAALMALQLSGLPTDRFLFAGFPPNKATARQKWLASLADVPTTLIFYESPNRLAAALADMAAVFGPRAAAVSRELTKQFEETRRGGLDTLARHYADQGAPKGEVCLCVAGPLPPEAVGEAEIDAALQQALETASVKVAAAEVAERLGLPKRSVYQRAITLRKGESTEGK